MQNEEDVEQLLNAALASYSAVDASPGWEAGILESIKRSKKWTVVFAIPIFAAIFVVVSLHRTPEPPLATERPSMTPRATFGIQPALATRSKFRPSFTAGHSRQQVFPTPAFLAPGERALVHLASQNPELLDSLLTDHSQPIEIVPLHIPVLQIDIENQEN